MALQDTCFSATGKIKDELGRGLPFSCRLVSLKTSYFLASAEALIMMACSHTTTAVALHIFFFSLCDSSPCVREFLTGYF